MPPAVPIATYRLQLNAAFRFEDAAAVVPYLKSLGISHVYVSPFMKARQGSSHGYDVVDHTTFNPELGGDIGFERFSAALKANDLGLILDFVPNHMGVHGADNAWWLDVLEWGPKSPFASSFDIDWDMLPHRTKPRLLLPILGASYGEALNRGEIELCFDPQAGSFYARYYENRLPIAPERYGDLLRMMITHAEENTSDTGRGLLSLAAAFGGKKHPERRQVQLLKQQLAEIPGAAKLIARGLEAFRATAGMPQVLALHHVLERQHYRLSHWRLASSEINFRRFFDINGLAGLRVEDRPTFNRVHTLVRRLIAEDKIQGLRIDHIDGLLDPTQYLQRIRRLIADAQAPRPRPFYLVVEKIVGHHETLQPFAAADGTTGYEWLNTITQTLVEPHGLKALDDIWRQASNSAPAFAPVLAAAKRRVLETMLASEFTVLTRLLARIAAGHYTTRDYSEDSLRQALTLYVIHFPVYRTYITAKGPSAADRALIRATIRKAQADWFNADAGVFDFLHDALTLDLLQPGRAPHSRSRVRRFAFKMQQFTPPLIAKALEDTAFYRYPRLLALNEVGGDPAASSLPILDFHHRLIARSQQWPHGMTATATHDTKRGEDARMRIIALAELSGEWTAAVGRWKLFNARFVTEVGPHRSPSIVDEYMLYQALVGAMPLEGPDQDFVARFQAYAQKAVREAKLQTSWLNPNADYERGLKTFIDNILDPRRAAEYLDSFMAFLKRAALIGALNSLSQLTLKATLPGVPDFYQGAEFWDLSLVDPDNRRPVDFGSRRAAFAAPPVDLAAATRNWSSGQIKLLWTRHLLTLRQQYPDLFARGEYIPHSVDGPSAEHVVAFTRRFRKQALTIIALRFFSPLTQGGTRWLEPGTLNATVTIDPIGRVGVSQLIRHVPATIMTSEALRQIVRPGRMASLI
jgi:(1->4)-alpha-D-glucan 1-alpha-D-glucosylmutase